jgi:peptide-methionine (S)-S-oxide reductase
MKTERAIFSAGCFWHVQHEFDKVKGVLKTTAGYIGGDEKNYPNPKYEMLHGDKTGYAEAVEVIFDPKIVSYKKLLDFFWKMHDPKLQNRQGPDVGTQYRAGIFYVNGTQKKEAEKSKKEIEKKLAPKKVYTSIDKAGTFFRAEEYHQKYVEKGGLDACPIKF